MQRSQNYFCVLFRRQERTIFNGRMNEEISIIKWMSRYCISEKTTKEE
jgi:hypothetical protein